MVSIESMIPKVATTASIPSHFQSVTALEAIND
jgi:hypothetical protein